MTKIIRAPRLLVLVAITALAALALATAGGVAAAPGGQGKGKAGAKGYKLSRGATTLDLSAGATSAFAAAGVTLSVDMPAKADSAGDLVFTNGRVKATTNGAGAITAATGKISHSGGFTLTKGDTTVSVRNLRIVLDSDPDLTALVSIGGETFRTSIADLVPNLSKIGVTSTGKRKRWLTIDDVVVKLNQDSVTALNTAFGTAFTAGAELGTADVKTRIVGRFPA